MVGEWRREGVLGDRGEVSQAMWIWREGQTLITQDVQQPVLDGWKASPEAWAATGSPLSWDSMQEMYNPKLGQPISNKVMNAFIRVVAEWGESGHLFLGTELYDTLGRFCLCSDGKCKYKGNTPLETALKAAGHEGVSWNCLSVC
jgi:hypothetical protein